MVKFQPCVMTWEQPDVVGWTCDGRSTLVECKASRADFKRDADKLHRLLAGVGNRRFFFAPPNLIRIAELPDGWGLVECHPSVVRLVVGARTRNHADKDSASEIKHLVHLLRLIRQPDPPAGELMTGCLPDVGL